MDKRSWQIKSETVSKFISKNFLTVTIVQKVLRCCFHPLSVRISLEYQIVTYRYNFVHCKVHFLQNFLYMEHLHNVLEPFSSFHKFEILHHMTLNIHPKTNSSYQSCKYVVSKYLQCNVDIVKCSVRRQFFTIQTFFTIQHVIYLID